MKQFITEAQRLQKLAGIKETKFDTTQTKELLNRLNSYSDKTFIWFDTETSGFAFDRPLQITQIAAIATDSEGNKLGEFNEKSKLDPKIAQAAEDPESNVSKALKINRYFDDTSNKREQQEILTDFVDWVLSFPNPLLIIYNVPFDMEVFNTVTKGKRLKSTTLDVMKLVQYFWIPLQQQLAEKGNKRSIEILDTLGTSGSSALVGSTLGKVANSLGIDSSAAHDAFGDVTMMSNVYREILKDLEQYQDVEIDKEYRRGRIAADTKFKRKDKENRKKLKKAGIYTEKPDLGEARIVPKGFGNAIKGHLDDFKNAGFYFDEGILGGTGSGGGGYYDYISDKISGSHVNKFDENEFNKWYDNINIDKLNSSTYDAEEADDYNIDLDKLLSTLKPGIYDLGEDLGYAKLDRDGTVTLYAIPTLADDDNRILLPIFILSFTGQLIPTMTKKELKDKLQQNAKNPGTWFII